MPVSTTMNKADATLAAQQNALRDLIDGGATPGKLKIYDGTKPATADTAISTQVLLANLTLPRPCAPDATDGVLTLDPIDPVVAVASSTATWARLLDGDGNSIADFDVAAAGSPAVLLDDAALVEGGGVTINSFVITEV